MIVVVGTCLDGEGEDKQNWNECTHHHLLASAGAVCGRLEMNWCAHTLRRQVKGNPGGRQCEKASYYWWACNGPG